MPPWGWDLAGLALQPHLWQCLLAGALVQEGQAGTAGDEVLWRLAVLLVHWGTDRGWGVQAGEHVGGGRGAEAGACTV